MRNLYLNTLDISSPQDQEQNYDSSLDHYISYNVHAIRNSKRSIYGRAILENAQFLDVSNANGNAIAISTFCIWFNPDLPLNSLKLDS